MSEYLIENGRRILILGQVIINGSFKYLGIPKFQKTSGPMWADNRLDPRSSWGYGDTYNQTWGVQTGGPYINVAMSWGTTIPAPYAYMNWSQESPRVSVHRVCDDFRRARHRKLDCRRSRSSNPVINTRFNRRGYDWDVLVDHIFF